MQCLLLLVDQFINFRHLDQLPQLVLDDEEDNWDLDRELPYEDIWVDLEEWRREEDGEEDEEEEVEEFAGSPTRRASYSSVQRYRPRLRSPVQVVGGGARPGRGLRGRSAQYYGHHSHSHHHSQPAPLYYRGRGGQGAGRFRPGGTEEGRGVRQFR